MMNRLATEQMLDACAVDRMDLLARRKAIVRTEIEVNIAGYEMSKRKARSLLPCRSHQRSSRIRCTSFVLAVVLLLGISEQRTATAYLLQSNNALALFGHQRIQSRLFVKKNGANRNGRHVDDASQPPLVNEWGIPNSSELPPLGNNKIPVPDQLPNGGRVTLVGSGPGDPELLTLAAYKLLTEDPDALVIADRLVSKEILDLIPGEIKTARKLPGCADLAQEEIYWWTHQGLSEGRHVIRLKIGDPFVFGRGGEEVLMFRRFGVEATVIPGVSSAFSAPLLGSIPVTHRGAANQVVMCTGYGREGTSPDLIRYHKEQTIVFLMAVGRLRILCQRLMEQAGYPGETPVAIVEKAGCPDQRTVTGNMRTIADIAERHAIKPPSTIIVGGVVNVLLAKDEDTGEAVTGLIQNNTAVFV